MDVQAQADAAEIPFTVQFAGLDDADTVAMLLRAMDAYWRPGGGLAEEHAYRAVARRTIETGEGTRFAICWKNDAAVGFACLAVLRPGHDLEGLIFLKDLFVCDAVRGRGAGRAMMRFIARFAIAEGIGRIDLTTETANAGAQRLYEALGATALPKISYRFDKSTMHRLAEP